VRSKWGARVQLRKQTCPAGRQGDGPLQRDRAFMEGLQHGPCSPTDCDVSLWGSSNFCVMRSQTHPIMRANAHACIHMPETRACTHTNTHTHTHTQRGMTASTTPGARASASAAQLVRPSTATPNGARVRDPWPPHRVNAK
jgi:hypothetical protein